MKLKMKLMAAAVALVAASGAHAAINNSATGNGELFFTIYDRGADLSSTADDRAYVRDLGSLLNFGSMNDWASPIGTGTNVIPTLDASKTTPNGYPGVWYADAGMQSFLAASTDLSRLLWNVAAADSLGHDRFLTTASSIANPGQLTGFRSLGTTTDVYLAAINPLLGSSDSVVLSGADANISKWGNNVGGKTTTTPMSFTNAAGLGESMNFFLLSERASSLNPTMAVTQQQFMASNSPVTWTLQSNGDLVVTAIPEPSEYALMLAGLGMLGFMARRRLNNRA